MLKMLLSDKNGPAYWILLLAPCLRPQYGQFMLKVRSRMPPLAIFVSSLLGNVPPVADKTNLPGIYDITLLLDWIAPTSSVGEREGGTRVPSEFSPPIPKALEDQLGLRL